MQTLPELVQQTERLVGLVGGQQQRVASLTAEVDRGEQESTLLTVTQATLDKLLQTMSAESVGKVERLVTYGLKTVFPDQDLTFRFDIQTKFRQPWLGAPPGSANPHLTTQAKPATAAIKKKSRIPTRGNKPGGKSSNF